MTPTMRDRWLRVARAWREIGEHKRAGEANREADKAQGLSQCLASTVTGQRCLNNERSLGMSYCKIHDQKHVVWRPELRKAPKRRPDVVLPRIRMTLDDTNSYHSSSSCVIGGHSIIAIPPETPFWMMRINPL